MESRSTHKGHRDPLGFVLRRRCQQAERGLPNGVQSCLALQFGMKSPIAVEVDRRQVEDIEIAGYTRGFAHVDFKKCAGHAGQRLWQQLLPRPASPAVRCAEQHHDDTGSGGETGMKLALGQA